MRDGYKVDFKLHQWQKAALDPIDGSGLPTIDIMGNVDKSFWDENTVDYHAEIRVTRDRFGKIARVIIQPLGVIEEPTIDPDEPIPYVVSDLGKKAVETYKAIGKEHPNAYVELDW